MRAYRITCAECDERFHGWSRAEARRKFREHVMAGHADGNQPITLRAYKPDGAQ